jgi:tRNA A-37 threonylcarbamoyl transferase component Bud32
MATRPSEQSNPAAVRRILAAARERRLLTERRARDGYRRASLLDERYVLKEFVYAPREHPARRPWRHEHAALTHLADPALPASVGYVSDETDGEWRVRYLRGYVPGVALEGFDAAVAAEAGVLLAGLHARGVVTDDPLTQNFMRAPDGRLFFLDFGKSRIFSPRNPLLLAWIALEHCRYLRASLGGDRELWAAFREAYFGAAHGSRGAESAIRSLSRLILWQRRLRGRSNG